MANESLLFSIQTLEVDDGHKLKGLKPDRFGVYKNIPLAVFDEVSRNKRHYDNASLRAALADDNSQFARACVEGNLEGEWGHPFIRGQQDLDRLVRIERSMLSHRFTAIRSQATTEGAIVVYGDVLPFGPYGKYLEEALQSPVINCAFSLRALSTQSGTSKDGAAEMKVVALITFDAVGMPGYKRATKRYALDTATESLGHSYVNEDFELEIPYYDPQLVELVDAQYSMESLESSALKDILETNQIKLHTRKFYFEPKFKQIRDEKGELDSVFHTMFRRA